MESPGGPAMTAEYQQALERLKHLGYNIRVVRATKGTERCLSRLADFLEENEQAWNQLPDDDQSIAFHDSSIARYHAILKQLYYRNCDICNCDLREVSR